MGQYPEVRRERSVSHPSSLPESDSLIRRSGRQLADTSRFLLIEEERKKQEVDRDKETEKYGDEGKKQSKREQKEGKIQTK
jgi:hypothetical protein